ncbi:MAG: formate dehydrogenase accessory sulfurtransferase FdhD, partial [Verrucomicrobiae bacterium]|nr:formate dehydrogenase accessory sulfurtransferase FdhD [Verrucomicrobiae bacterium]
MGSDKAFLDWNGRPLYVTQLEKLHSIATPGRLLLSARRGQAFPDYLTDVTLVWDTSDDLGPIGALRDCLKRLTPDENLLFLAVDLPRMSESFLDRLRHLANETGSGIVPKVENRWEPLAAIYPHAILPLVDDQIERGELSLQRLCDRAEAEGWIAACPVPANEIANFANVNTREEFDLIQQGQFDHPTLLNRFSLEKGFVETHDRLAAEEPLEIRVEEKSVAVVMRTPGHDDELAAGFLLTEGVIRSSADLFEIRRCRDIAEPHLSGNVIAVQLAPNHEADLEKLTRHVFTSSSCGVCGKATIESVFQDFPAVGSNLQVSPETLLSLPVRLGDAQKTFQKTGGLHASALFDREGTLTLLREDVGRHNALDKVIGRSLLDDR